jgi:Ca-activated chloride channel family protein
MTIGDRTIRGIIREREQAEQIYAAAKAQGYVASIMTEERPNIFTQKVANIEPGKAIDINIKYYSTLTYSDGGYEFFFPMVVGPRFNPAGTTDGVGAVAKGAEGASGQKTEVQYLRPEQRSGHDISLAVDIDAGVSIEKITCRDHVVDVLRHSPTAATVRLSQSDNIPNRDFVLRYEVAGDYVKSAMMTHEDSRGGFFTMMLVPPKDLAKVQRGALEMVFVLDCSGSMSGRPIEQAKAAIERGLMRLQPGDSFQIIDFAETATALGNGPLEATPENIRRGLAFLKPLDANGGTYMINGLRASLDFPHDAVRGVLHGWVYWE